jgi:hypothetical protein
MSYRSEEVEEIRDTQGNKKKKYSSKTTCS